jgi:hypothetical protein
MVLITQFIASILGGSGSFSKSFLLFSATYSPIFILSGICSALSNVLPWFGYFSILVWLYGYGLSILITKYVNDLSLSRAVMSALPILVFAITDSISKF